MNIRIDRNTLDQISTNVEERDMYLHPNALVRDISWQRLEEIERMIAEIAENKERIVDLGGGTGLLARSLCEKFDEVELVDWSIDDAEKLRKRFNLENLLCTHLNFCESEGIKKSSAMVATDVLEHIKSLDTMMPFMRGTLREGGWLFVSLPTENFLYEMGRKVFKKEKPHDHYHSATEIVAFLESNGFRPVKNLFSPKYGLRVPLYYIGAFEFLPSKLTK